METMAPKTVIGMWGKLIKPLVNEEGKEGKTHKLGLSLISSLPALLCFPASSSLRLVAGIPANPSATGCLSL